MKSRVLALALFSVLAACPLCGEEIGRATAIPDWVHFLGRTEDEIRRLYPEATEVPPLCEPDYRRETTLGLEVNKPVVSCEKAILAFVRANLTGDAVRNYCYKAVLVLESKDLDSWKRELQAVYGPPREVGFFGLAVGAFWDPNRSARAWLRPRGNNGEITQLALEFEFNRLKDKATQRQAEEQVVAEREARLRAAQDWQAR